MESNGVMKETVDAAACVEEQQQHVDLSRMYKLDDVSPSLVKRLKDADIDKDGRLSLEELVHVVRSEQQAQADRKLFRNFVIALALGMLILIAAVCGAVYGIVHLSNQLDDNNGVLASASTGEAMATGQAMDLINLTQLYDGNVAMMETAQNLQQVVVAEGDGAFSVHKVARIRVIPSESRAIIVSMDGSILQADDSGLGYLNDSISDDAQQGSARRRLMANQTDDDDDAMPSVPAHGIGPRFLFIDKCGLCQLITCPAKGIVFGCWSHCIKTRQC